MNSFVFTVALCAAIVFTCRGKEDENKFTNATDCNKKEMYKLRYYNYTATEKYFGDFGEYNQNYTITVIFFTHCVSVGTYGIRNATMYELNITFYSMGGNILEKPGNPATDIDFAECFKFVQTDDGLIPLTIYDREDNANVVNIKKSITSAFQGNFLGKTLRTEADAQSTHQSEYSFYASLEDKDKDVMKMTRQITANQVEGYAQHIPKDEVYLNKVEKLQFMSSDEQSGDKLSIAVLSSASGTVNTKMMPKTLAEQQTDVGGDEERDQSDTLENEKQRQKRDTSSNAQDSYNTSVITSYYESSGSYLLVMLNETTITKLPGRHRRSVDKGMLPENIIASSLLVYINQTERVILRMAEARNSLGDIEDSLSYLYYHPKDIAIAHKLEKLIKLEAEYGSILDYPPAIDDVLEYLYLPNLVGSNNTSDKQMRYNIYFMITPDGSLSSQMALLDCYKVAVDDDERDTLVMYISSVAKPKPRFVVRLEHMISSDVHSNDPLLLAYGSLYPTASSELQRRIFLFLFQRLSNSKQNPDSLVHHILSLGNTASPNMSRYLVDFLNHDQENVKLSAILAMRFIMNQKVVLNALKMFMYGPTATEDHLIMIVKALIYGIERSKINKEETPYSPGFVEDLVNSSLYYSHNHDLISILDTYLLTADNTHTRGLRQDIENFNRRFRRETSKDDHWADKNDVYDLVEPYAVRVADTNIYTNRKNYIWGKKFGGKDINVQIAAGAFAGVGNTENKLSDGGYAVNYKLYGHAVAKAHCYDYTLTMLEFLVMRRKSYNTQKKNVETLTELYAVVMGKTVKKYKLLQDGTICKTIDKPIYEAKDYTIFDFTYSVFVVVGTLDFELNAKVHFTSGLYVEFCESGDRITIGAGLSPTITLVVAASGDLQIALVAKAGLTLSATLNYQLLPEVTTDLCIVNNKAASRNCVGIYHQWDDNAIDLYAWYAWRGWCGWFFCLGSDAFKTKHKISALSKEWKLPGTKKQEIAKGCDNNLKCGAPAAPAFGNF